MPGIRGILATFAAVAFLCAMAAHAQDAQPSLGDAARQARLQKQQKDAEAGKNAPGKDLLPKDAQSKDSQSKDLLAKDGAPPKTKKVVTNDEIPEHIGPTRTLPPAPIPGVNTPQPNYDGGNPPAEYWKTQIQAQKNYISSLESQIASLGNSIQYASSNCVTNCVQWNERQQEKQQQLAAMKDQLEALQKSLEELQDMARKQGYGSSVYDP